MSLAVKIVFVIFWQGARHIGEGKGPRGTCLQGFTGIIVACVRITVRVGDVRPGKKTSCQSLEWDLRRISFGNRVRVDSRWHYLLSHRLPLDTVNVTNSLLLWICCTGVHGFSAVCFDSTTPLRQRSPDFRTASIHFPLRSRWHAMSNFTVNAELSHQLFNVYF